ncbi:MAG: RAD55 family ATPase [Candidatus Thermoplasmatota archaeon]|nr:RAD55 family ATPase [Candidatus Thermoplasmatota archaeon]MDD5779222.1 RAD55 family ATPase [Candidatus Thermoplasmatota archaeon]
MLVKTGIDRLDELLKDGLPAVTNTLLYAPPFIGKETILKSFALTGLQEGEPAIFVLTDTSFAEMKEEMQKMDAHFARYEDEGKVKYIDVYSKGVELREEGPNVIFVDSPINRERITASIIKTEKEFQQKYERHRLVFDSISTLIVYADAKAVFRFLQVVSGTCKRLGATSLFSMTRGMHEEIEVQTIKHLMDGVIEMREEASRMQIRVQGCGEVVSRNWIDYLLEKDEIRLTGAFRMSRVA